MGQSICLDTELIAQYGYNAAAVFERLWFFIESRKCDNSQAEADEAGRWWLAITNRALLDQFVSPSGKSLMSKRTLQASLKTLKEAGVLEIVQVAGGNQIAINVEALEQIVGAESFARYAAQRRPKVNRGAKSAPPMQNLHPPTIKKRARGAKSARAGVQNLHPPLIYKDLDESIDESIPTSNEVGGACAPTTDTEKKNHIFGVWKTLTYPARQSLTKNEGSLVGRSRNNIIRRFGLEATFDAIARFEAWLILTDDWYCQGRISQPGQLEKSFEGLMDFENKNGAQWFADFEHRYPNWRDHTGNLTTFAGQARMEFPSLKKTGKARYERRPYQTREAEPVQEVTPSARQLEIIRLMKEKYANGNSG